MTEEELNAKRKAKAQEIRDQIEVLKVLIDQAAAMEMEVEVEMARLKYERLGEPDINITVMSATIKVLI